MFRTYMLNEVKKRGLDEVIKNCQPYLKDLKASGWDNALYKGSSTKLDISKGRITPHKCPYEASYEVWNAFFDFADKACGVDLRKTSVMCTPIEDHTISVPGGSKAHAILPIGSYKLYGHPTYDYYYLWEFISTDENLLNRDNYQEVVAYQLRTIIPDSAKFAKKFIPKDALQIVMNDSGKEEWRVKKFLNRLFVIENMFCGPSAWDKEILDGWSPQCLKWLTDCHNVIGKEGVGRLKQVDLNGAQDTYAVFMVCQGYYVLKLDTFKKLINKLK